METKRSETRYVKKLATVATISRCEQDKSLEGCPIKFDTIDVSGHGIRFRSDLILQRGTLISISIAYNPSDVFTVSGEVRWFKMELGKPTMGVQLLEDKDTDFERWLALLNTDMERPDS